MTRRGFFGAVAALAASPLAVWSTPLPTAAQGGASWVDLAPLDTSKCYIFDSCQYAWKECR